jgi:hypothetical protein
VESSKADRISASDKPEYDLFLEKFPVIGRERFLTNRRKFMSEFEDTSRLSRAEVAKKEREQFEAETLQKVEGKRVITRAAFDQLTAAERMIFITALNGKVID